MKTNCFLTSVTQTQIAANNGSQNEGNRSTLHKIYAEDEIRTLVSGPAIKQSLRMYMQEHYPLQVNRIYSVENDEYIYRNQEKKGTKVVVIYNPEENADEDAFGYMKAEEGVGANKRKAAVEVTPAISLDSYGNETIFGVTAGTKNSNSIHENEVHLTAYQYTVSMPLKSFVKPERANIILDAIAQLKGVGGKHSNFLYDFRPESIVIRVTDDWSPWIINCFKRTGKLSLDSNSVGCPRLIELIQSGDIAADELIVAGRIANTEDGETLKRLGVKVIPSVKQAIADTKEIISQVCEEIAAEKAEG